MSTLAPAITFRSAILQLLRAHQPHEEPDSGPPADADLPIEPQPSRPSFEDLQTVPAVYNPLPEYPPVQPGLPAPDWCGC